MFDLNFKFNKCKIQNKSKDFDKNKIQEHIKKLIE